MNKEQLIAENAVLKDQLKSAEASSDLRKSDMCRVLGFTRTEIDYGTRKTVIDTKTWAEIFAEIGKLKALRDFRDCEGDISELECDLEDAQKTLEMLIKSKQDK